MNVYKKCVSLATFFIIALFMSLLRFTSSLDEQSINCTQSYNCGNIKDLKYPFWGAKRPHYCGLRGFELECSANYVSIITIASLKYRILAIDIHEHKLIVARDDCWDDLCHSSLIDTTLDYSDFDYVFTPTYFTFFYACSFESMRGIDHSQLTSCNGSCVVLVKTGEYFPHNSGSMGVLNIPTSKTLAPGQEFDVSSVLDLLHEGFEIHWKQNDEQCTSCEESGGQCGRVHDKNKFACFCPDQTYSSKCPSSQGKSSKTKGIIIGLAIGGACLFAAALALCFLIVQRRRRSLSQARSKDVIVSNPSTGNPSSNGLHSSQVYTTSPSTTYMSNSGSYPSSKSDFENSATYFGVKVFSYNELEEATENFHESRELGDGGFGTVYYGKLNDGRIVAVKRLYENSCRHMGQFMNEIRILAHLRHKNLVTLYGCTSRRSRELLLVYEYIPNGTVADHLHGKLSKSNILPWSTRFKIAVETAEALSFLHEKEVVHRDVKTTNILLDNTFQVKVADFGLSRLFPTDVTHVSTAPQGTPGYVDPEYHQCYQLTEKSDVYSFGVVLAELISSKVAVDITRHRHDINLANMAVDRIHKHALDELIDPKLELEKDSLAEKMVKLVAELAFRCLQQERDARPSMKEVLETLIGIQKELANEQKQVVVDIHESDKIGLLKNVPPPLSPDTESINKSIV